MQEELSIKHKDSVKNLERKQKLFQDNCQVWGKCGERTNKNA